jgi:hypothetical protein
MRQSFVKSDEVLDDEDMMFLGKKDQDEGDDEDNPLFIVNSDDNFW